MVSIPGRAHPVTALYLEDAIEHSGYVLEEGSEFAKKPDQKGGGKGGGRDGGGGFGGRDHKAMVKQQMGLENLDKDGGEDSPLWWKRELPGYSMRTYESLTRVADEGINYELITQLLEHICFNCGEGAVRIFGLNVSTFFF